jgi:hypothetical protein
MTGLPVARLAAQTIRARQLRLPTLRRLTVTQVMKAPGRPSPASGATQ